MRQYPLTNQLSSLTHDDSKTLELMTKSGNVFCIKEGTELTKELLLNLNNYIKLKLNEPPLIQIRAK